MMRDKHNKFRPRSMATDRRERSVTLNSKAKPWLLGIVVTGVSLLVLAMITLGIISLWSGFWPGKTENLTIHKRHYAGTVALNNNTLSIMSYNVKYMEGNQSNFIFYGDNNDSWTTQDNVITTINNVAQIIEDNNPDIILLQEVDIDSKRSFYINEIKALLNKISGEYQYWTCAPYLKSKLFPSEYIWEKVNMNLCTISKFPITTATRYALPNVEKSSFFKRQVTPKQALLETTITVNNKTYKLYNLHLSAQAYHTQAVNPQLKILQDLIEGQNNFVVGGDFNMFIDAKFMQYIPEEERKYGAGDDKTFKTFLEKYQPVPTVADLNSADFKKYFTFMGTGSADNPPDRTSDYFFLPKQMKLMDYKVINNDLSVVLSDHLPILVRVEG